MVFNRVGAGSPFFKGCGLCCTEADGEVVVGGGFVLPEDSEEGAFHVRCGGGPGCDGGVEGVAVCNEDGVVVEEEVSGVGDGGVVVAGDECDVDFVGTGEVDEFEELAVGLFAVVEVVNFGGVAVDDEVRGVLPERLERAWGEGGASGSAEVEV